MADCISEKKLRLGEGPVWDSRRNRLYYVDIEGREIGCYNPQTGKHTYMRTEKMVGCVVLDEDGNLIAAEEDTLVHIDVCSGERRKIAVFDLPGGLRFNDGKCDCMGRLWVGTMAIDQNAPYAEGCGALYRYENGKADAVLGEMSIPNGIAFSPDNRIMYHIDTPTRKIDSYAFDAATGILSDKKTAVRIGRPGNPDGMTIDCEGMLWVALWGGFGIARYDPRTGEELQFVPLPDSNVSCCTFGGEEGNILFITTAEDEEGNGGCIYQWKAGVRGPEPYLFTGGSKR